MLIFAFLIGNFIFLNSLSLLKLTYCRLSLLISVFQSTRLNSLVLRLSIVAFFPLLTSKLCLSLLLSKFPTTARCLRSNLSRLATLCSYAIFRSRSDPSWPTPQLGLFLNSQFQGIFLLRQNPSGGIAFVIIFMFYIYFIFFCRLVLSPVLFFFPAPFLKLVCRPDA